MKKIVPRLGSEIVDALAQLDDEEKKKKVLNLVQKKKKRVGSKKN
jgi:hypothetical protein